MMRRAIIAIMMTLAWSVLTATPRAFKLPRLARVVATENGGWSARGEIAVSFEQAKKLFAVRLAAEGWAHLHTIALGNDRDLEAWTRCGEELTLMTWRLGAGKAGFSYGITGRDEQKSEQKGGGEDGR